MRIGTPSDPDAREFFSELVQSTLFSKFYQRVNYMAHFRSQMSHFRPYRVHVYKFARNVIKN